MIYIWDEILVFSRWVVLDSLRPHGLQHTRPLCPPLSPGVCSNSCPPCAIQPSHLLPPLLPSAFSLSQSFPMSQFFTAGGQSTGASTSASVLPMNIQGWFPLGLTGLISLLSKRLSRVFSNTTVQKHQFFGTQPSLWSNSQIYTKTIALTIWTFISKVRSLLFNMLFRFVIAFLPRSKSPKY